MGDWCDRDFSLVVAHHLLVVAGNLRGAQARLVIARSAPV